MMELSLESSLFLHLSNLIPVGPEEVPGDVSPGGARPRPAHHLVAVLLPDPGLGVERHVEEALQPIEASTTY